MRFNKKNIAIGVSISVVVIGGAIYLYKKKKKPVAAKFGGPATNMGKLELLHPKYRIVFTRFVKAIGDLGYKVQINSTYRDFAKQAVLKKEDKRNASPGFSLHNYGLAVDLQVSKDGKTYGKNTPIKEWEKTGIPALAKKYGLDWGGLFPGYPDAVHFYVSGMDNAKLYNLALNQFKTKDPNKIVGNEVKLAERALKRSCGCHGLRCGCRSRPIYSKVA